MGYKSVTIGDCHCNRCHCNRSSLLYLAGARGHLEEAVSLGVDRPLQLAHVRELLRVDEVVGELHQEAGHVQLHRQTLSFSCNVNILNFLYLLLKLKFCLQIQHAMFLFFSRNLAEQVDLRNSQTDRPQVQNKLHKVVCKIANGSKCQYSSVTKVLRVCDFTLAMQCHLPPLVKWANVQSSVRSALCGFSQESVLGCRDNTDVICRVSSAECIP